MNNVNIIVMGKTGAGKSTLINAVLDEEVAVTGKGHAVTRTNTIYSKKMTLPINKNRDGKYEIADYNLNMYDTVGLEIDEKITDNTLKEIRQHIEDTKHKIKAHDTYVVWFCVNERSNRFEDYELSLIKKLSIEYEIPFIIVVTRHLSEGESELERGIKKHLPEICIERVLAKNYISRNGEIMAHGVMELLKTTVNNYKNLKIKIIEQKLFELDLKRRERIYNIEKQGIRLVEKYTSSATKIGFVPGGCIPIVHGMCVKMISDLNHAAGFKNGNAFAKEVFNNAILGAIATPLMLIPIFSAAAASSYVQTVGESYLKALLSVINFSSDKEIEDSTLMELRLKAELRRLYK